MELSEILVLTVEDLNLKLVELGINDDGPKTVLHKRFIRHFGFGQMGRIQVQKKARRI